MKVTIVDTEDTKTEYLGVVSVQYINNIHYIYYEDGTYLKFYDIKQLLVN